MNLFAANDVNAARALMGDSLAFHIIFALLGVGLPLIISLIEFWGLRKKNDHVVDIAHKLSKVAIILVVAGVVSGTIIAVQMPLMWPGLVEFGSKIIGLPFLFEGYMFLLEALFLAFYVSTWGKISGYKHWLLSLPIVLGSLGSAFFITSVNSWMQKPGGFDGIDKLGNLINPDPWAGILTKTTFFMSTHSILAYYVTTALLVLGGLAWYLYKHKPKEATKKAVEFVMYRLAFLAVLGGLLVGFIGHLNLQYLATSQPHKFAAIELDPKTMTNAPYIIGGKLSEDGQTVEGGIRIPKLLSLLTTNRTSGEVPGLDQTDRKDWPMLFIHTLFEIKMLLVGLMIAIPLTYVLIKSGFKHRRWAKWLAKSKLALVSLVAVGPIAIIVVQLGWMVTEFGRQPYIVRGYLTTEAAFSNNPAVLQWGYIFPVLYVLLFIFTFSAVVLTLRRMKPKDTK